MISWARWFFRIGLGVSARLTARGWLPLGLKGKVLAMYLASTLVILPATALLYSRALADQIAEEYKEEALGIWRVFDATYPTGEDLRGPLVQERLQRLREANPDVYEIRVYTAMDSRFMAVASSTAATVGLPAAVDDLQPMLQDRIIWRELGKNGEPLLELGAPLHSANRPIGVLIVHFRLAPRDQLIRRQVATYFGITGASGLLLLAALYWELRRVVLQPLVILQRHATAIMHGDLGFRTEINRSDEVGQLARDFNQMAAALEQRQQENVQRQDELQHR